MTESMSEIGLAKQRLREEFSSYRQSLDDAEYEAAGRDAADLLGGMDVVRSAQTIHVYRPIVRTRELDTRPFIDMLVRDGKHIVLPVVEKFERHGRGKLRMAHRSWHSETPLMPNRWGIDEPGAGRVVDEAEIDLVVVPALGAGRNGHRIGHGFGFYDEFLTRTDALRVCLIYEACLVEAVPHEAHDARMQIIVTESRVLNL